MDRVRRFLRLDGHHGRRRAEERAPANQTPTATIVAERSEQISESRINQTLAAVNLNEQHPEDSIAEADADDKQDMGQTDRLDSRVPVTEISVSASEDNRNIVQQKQMNSITPAIPPDLSDAGQVLNEANGYSYLVKKLERVKRFIVLGTEGKTFYATQKERYDENVKCVLAILKENNHVDGLLNMLEQYSKEGRVTKEDAILASLMTCVMFDDKEIQRKAYSKVVTICNMPTKLFRFVELCQDFIKAHPKQPKPSEVVPRRQRSKKRKSKATETSDSVVEQEPKKKKAKSGRSIGWGRMRRTSIGSFYTDPNKNAERLLYLLTKYKNRNNWSHRQVLGYTHPKFSKDDEGKIAKEMVLCYATRGYAIFQKRLKDKTSKNDQLVSRIVSHVELLEKVKKLQPAKNNDVDTLIDYINKQGIRDHDDSATFHMAVPGKQPTAITATPADNKQIIKKEPFQLVREHIPTGFLKIGKVWEALLQDMPMTALIRNLGRMSSFSLFEKKQNEDIVVNALTNPQRLKGARIHPMKILIALKAYEQGKSGPVEQLRSFMFSQQPKDKQKRDNDNQYNWIPNRKIMSALDQSFYLSFKQPELKKTFKTGKKFMLALDVSGSMTFQGCFGCEQVTPAIASTALSMVTWNIEDNVEMVAFGGYLEKLESYGLRKDMELKEALSTMRRINFGSTDCSLPMTYAKNNRLEIDVFIVYTDSDTGYGKTNPAKALKEYRQAMNRDAKLIVMAMTSNGFSIADPEDAGMLDIVGFDPNVPEMIAEFVRGEEDSHAK